MTDNDIKEALSRAALDLIASRSGIKCYQTGSQDNGVDCRLQLVVNRNVNRNSPPRFVDSGSPLAVQMKATTEKQVSRKNGNIVYRIENKTYNDLLHERENNHQPWILGLFILPDDPGQWLTFTEDVFQVTRHLYYWTIPDDATWLENENSRKTIYIVFNRIPTFRFYK